MAVERSLKDRPVAIRNHCLSQLAAEHGLPVPADGDVALIDPRLSLEEAWTQWRAAHAASTTVVLPAPADPPRRVRRWRSARVEVPVLVALSAVLAALVVRPRSSIVELENPAPVAAIVPWTPVTDSARLQLSASLQAMRRSRLPLSTSLSPSELTALMFSRLQPRQFVRLDSLESRIDSLWWVRGRLRDGARFEIGGRVYLAQRRRAEVRVSRLVVNGSVIPLQLSDQVLARIQGRPATTRSGRVWFEVPDFVANLWIGQGSAPLHTRGARTP